MLVSHDIMSCGEWGKQWTLHNCTNRMTSPSRKHNHYQFKPSRLPPGTVQSIAGWTNDQENNMLCACNMIGIMGSRHCDTSPTLINNASQSLASPLGTFSCIAVHYSLFTSSCNASEPWHACGERGKTMNLAQSSHDDLPIKKTQPVPVQTLQTTHRDGLKHFRLNQWPGGHVFWVQHDSS
jgi:hypothetical protein